MLVVCLMLNVLDKLFEQVKGLVLRSIIYLGILKNLVQVLAEEMPRHSIFIFPIYDLEKDLLSLEGELSKALFVGIL